MSENTERDELTETEIEADRNAAEARVTAPDPRLGEIEARLFHLGYVVEHGSSDALHVALGEDLAYLLAELRTAREALARVEGLAKYLDTLAGGDKHYAKLIRAAVAASGGGGE